jgi:hypothetical protein
VQRTAAGKVLAGRLATPEPVVLDQILPDRHRIPPTRQRGFDQLAIGLAGTGARRGRRVGGHLLGNCWFGWTFAWPTGPANGNPCRAPVLADRDAMDACRPGDTRERQSQPTERENFLLFVWLQDVAHGREGLHVPRRRQRLGRRQLMSVLRCRLIVGFGCPPRHPTFAAADVLR